MKKMKRFLLLMTCTFILLGTTACGSRDNADNGADQSTTDRTDTEDNDDRTMNDATEGDGILDDAVDDVTDGVDDVTDDVTDGIDRAADDMTEDDKKDGQEDVQELINRYNKIIDEKLKVKEEELMSV